MYVDISGDCDFEIGDRRESAASNSAPRDGGENPSTALSQETEVSVKWNVQPGWSASHSRTLGYL
jgi:hypothetical protein